ncbi:MAG: macro domain-containing protein [Campylobacteraceae bacterium]|jgi:O-acetyl-ADP-ribose deacetylase (regulator of RNase III)|nr:macro domain-containing protein [Campylobacteraceae bacterium]
MIFFVQGDATDPKGEGNKIIAHICNDIGGWGRGFVLSLSKRWREPRSAYIRWFISQENFILGEVQFVAVSDQISVANMIAQRDVEAIDGVPPIRYDALEKCLSKVQKEAKRKDASVHMPRIGCGLAGGRWEKVEEIIKATLLDVDVFVYDLR